MKPKNIPIGALDLVEREMPNGGAAQLEQAIVESNWTLAFLCVESHLQMSLCMELWPSLTDEEKPVILAEAISTGECPWLERTRLQGALHELHERGQRVFDGDAAREKFKVLPDRITIYRGTVEAEYDEEYGVSWNLDRETAVFFATKHGRYRNTQSPPVIVSTTVNLLDVSGLLLERHENEVLMCSEWIWSVTLTRP